MLVCYKRKILLMLQKKKLFSVRGINKLLEIRTTIEYFLLCKKFPQVSVSPKGGAGDMRRNKNHCYSFVKIVGPLFLIFLRYVTITTCNGNWPQSAN